VKRTTAIQSEPQAITDVHAKAASTVEPTGHPCALLVEAIQDIGLFMLDPAGLVLTWNTGAERISGYTSTDILGQNFEVLLPIPSDPSNTGPLPLDTAANTGRYEAQGWSLRKDGSRFWSMVILSPIYVNANLEGFAVVTRDLTQRLERSEALSRSEIALQKERDRLQVTLEAIGDGVISTDTEGRILFLNAVASSLTGWSLDEARGLPIRHVFHLVPAGDGTSELNPVEACLATRTPYPLRDGGRLLSRNGQEHVIQDSAAPILDRNGELTGAVLVFQDVTHVRQVQTELRHQTLHDALTGLPNRKQLENKLQDAIEDSEVRGTEHVLCFLDLDRFKIINDTAGHSVGDMFLRAATEAIRRGVRDTDLVARLGGDEFAILLLDCRLEEAAPILTRVAEAVAAIRFQWEGHLYQVTVSIGVAGITQRSGSSSHVMKQADVACYSAKRAGRNRVMLYRPDQAGGEENHRELHMAAEIGEALVQNRFTLYAQKIVPTKPGAREYCEILIRMIDRDGGHVPPGDFIPAAERYDLMVEIDRWVMQEVFTNLAPEILRHPCLTVSLNVSAQSLNDPKFLPFFLDLLKRSGIPGSRLILEITETAIVNNLSIASAIVEQLRSYGCRVALDDFGTGLSSFGYLRTFRVDLIKIEGSFVRNMLSNPVDLTIVRSINQIAHELKILTVAEFVEDQATIQMLEKLGVDFGQGYALGRPEPVLTLLESLPCD
jgi:diguanylate cyclase (GGDEF)-like protein/PAS domain S-box-containing protein